MSAAIAGVVGFFLGRRDGEARGARVFPQLLKAERKMAFELVAGAFEVAPRETSIEEVAFMPPPLEQNLTRRSLELLAQLPAHARAIVQSPVRELIQAAIREHRFRARLVWLDRLGLTFNSEALEGFTAEEFAEIADSTMMEHAKGEAIRVLAGAGPKEDAPPARPPLPPSLRK